MSEPTAAERMEIEDEEDFARFVRERTAGNPVSRSELRELREEYDEERRDAR